MLNQMKGLITMMELQRNRVIQLLQEKYTHTFGQFQRDQVQGLVSNNTKSVTGFLS